MIGKLLNTILAPLNFHLTKRSSMEQILGELQTIQQQYQEMQRRDQDREETLLRLQQQEKEHYLRMLEYSMFSRWQTLDRLESMAPYPRRETCPLCGASLPKKLLEFKTQCIFKGGVLVRYQCPYCDVIFGPEKMLRLSTTALSEEYQWHYTFSHESDCNELEKQGFFELNPRRNGIYLNYGGGAWSHSTKELRDAGWCVYNFEPYASASEEYVIRDRAQLATMKFDGIFSHDLMEHLLDPIGELQFMASLLHPGGTMNHVTGCWEYLYEYTRFHLFFFLGRSRELLAQRAGLHFDGYARSGYYCRCMFSVPTVEMTDMVSALNEATTTPAE